jgi:hypothetical protein
MTITKKKYDHGIDLQVHPDFSKYPISNVIETMVRNDLHAVSIQGYNNKLILPKILNQLGLKVPHDSAGMRVCLKYAKDVFLLDGQEHFTQEGFHILTIGTSFKNGYSNYPLARDIINQGLERKALVAIDHSYTDNIHTGTMGDISAEKEVQLEDICREFSGQIALELNGYCEKTTARLMLKYALRFCGHEVRFHNVNKKTQELSDKLSNDGINVPTFATTDVHARNLSLLNDIGTARTEMDIEGETPSEVLTSIKKNLFDGNYENILKPVSWEHLINAKLSPMILSKLKIKQQS